MAALIYETPGWKSHATDSTRNLESACGMIAEMHLITARPMNWVQVIIKNRAAESRVYKTGEVRITFSGGHERIPDITGTPAEVEIRPGVLATFPIIFPDKKDFQDKQWVELAVPFYSRSDDHKLCELTTRFNRDETQPDKRAAYTSETSFEMGLDVGSPFSRTGAMGNLGSPAGEFGVFGAYYREHHGAGLLFGLEGFGGGNSALLSPLTAGASNPQLLGFYILPVYIYRFFLSDKWTLNLGAGIGMYFFTLGNSSPPNQALATLAITERVSAQYRLARLPRGIYEDLFCGASLYNIIVPTGSFSGVPVSGSSFGLTAQLGFGF